MTTSVQNRQDAPRTRNAQAGPPLGPLALAFTGLFTAGLVFQSVLGDGTPYPEPFAATAAEVAGYFAANSSAVQTQGFFMFASSMPLMIFSATAMARLHRLGVRAPGANIALAGGLIAAAMQIVCAAVVWTMSHEAVAAAEGTVQALHLLGFALGGVGIVAPMGLLIAGLAVPSLLARLTPRPVAWIGLALALLCELSLLSLLVEELSVLLPIGRFLGMAWLVVVGFTLPKNRAPKNARK
ncbi:hypothetical protein [Salininema proteolyticum]|uniref:DUF4386 domain-containing protein n=1 Tax=Salininema proteolyticum TaxID=1607685 RepID=A0ABV8U5J6_9ACTN